MIQGYDVAGFQSTHFPLFDTVNGKPIDFAIIKVTEGTGFTNSRWVDQRAWARDHGLSVGFYHFLHKGNTRAQADFFLSRIALQPGDHLWCDWETNPADNTHPPGSEKDAWIRYVQEQRPGHRVGLYCNTSFWKTLDTSGFAGDGLWIATGGIPAGDPPIASAWRIHQYSTANGIDHDVAQFTDRAAMIAWAEGEDDVALSADDKTWIKNTIAAAVRASLDDIATKVLTLDGVLESPADASDHATNPFWSLETYTKDTGAKVRAAEKTLAGILTQARSNGSSLTAIMQTLSALDLSGLPDAVAAKLAKIKIVLEEQA